MMTEEFASPKERANALKELREWLAEHKAPHEPIIAIDILNKTFTPYELIAGLEAGSAIAEALLEVVIEEARESKVSVRKFVEHLGAAPEDGPMKPSANGKS